MTLREKRCLFTKLIAELILWCFDNGYEVSLQEVVRSKAQANANAASGAGIRNSLHLIGLAADLNLYIEGVYQTTTQAHKPIGDKWKTMHPLCRWGGEFGDGNHYSVEHNGVK